MKMLFILETPNGEYVVDSAIIPQVGSVAVWYVKEKKSNER